MRIFIDENFPLNLARQLRKRRLPAEHVIALRASTGVVMTNGERVRLTFEEASGETGLANDTQERADLELVVVRNRHRDRRALDSSLHDDVTAAPPDLDETLRLQNPADLTA